jgi:hypothetical protein
MWKKINLNQQEFFLFFSENYKINSSHETHNYDQQDTCQYGLS